MKKIFSTLLVCLVNISIFSSCNPDDNPTPQPNNPTPGFKWHENSPTATEKTAGSSEVRTQFKSIFAFQGSNSSSGTLFEMNLTAVSPGTYTIGSANAFYFSGNTATPTSGKVVITANAGGKASGTFEAAWASGTITSVTGSFTDIPVN